MKGRQDPSIRRRIGPGIGHAAREAHTRSKGCDGLTLVEAVVALMIFALCIAGFCGASVCFRELSDRARTHYTAVNIAKNRLERAKTAEFSQLHLFEESQTRVDYLGSTDASGDYRRTTSVSNATEGLTEVVVTVEIKDRVTLGFDRESETVGTYIADFEEVEE